MSCRSNEWENIWNKKVTVDNIPLHFVSGFDMMSYKSWRHLIKIFINIIGEKKFDSVIDIGCSAGAFLKVIKNIVPDSKLYGCDISHSSIKRISDNLDGIFLLSNASDTIYEFKDVATLSISFSVFQYFNDYTMARKVLENMYLYTKNKGTIFVGDIPDYFKKEIDIKERKFKKRKKSNHMYYKKSFFTNFAQKYNLHISIYDHDHLKLPLSFPNKKSRFSIIMAKK